MTTEPIIDMYAGPGGWSEGLRALGLSDIGIERDPDACQTRANAGHRTIRADLADYPAPSHLRGRCALIASPPCPTFSAAGTGKGRAEIPRLVAQCHAGDWRTEGLDDRTLHVLTVGRWIDALRPTWIALEQVPAVLPVWRALGHLLRSWGYSVATAELCAADYGVPQTRRRAVLMASKARAVSLPVATHAEHPGLFGELPWITMADALGWGREKPARTLCGDRQPRWLYPDNDGTHGEMVLDRRQQNPDGTPVPPVPPVPPVRPAPTLTGKSGQQWVWRRPATTVCGDPRLGNPGHRDREGGEPQFAGDAIKLTFPEALTLQSFRADYPMAGNKSSRFTQVGNAVPPLLSMHIVAELTGQAVRAAA